MAELKSQIRRRLAAIGAERERLQRKLGLLAEVEKELRSLLQQPQAVARPKRVEKSPRSGGAKAAATGAASEMIERVLSEGAKSKGELANALEAAQFDFEGKAPGRVVHQALVSMMRKGLIEKTQDGKLAVLGRRQRV